MSYQDFLNNYPYCVEYYFGTKSIVVKNGNYAVIAEYYAQEGLDFKCFTNAFKSFCFNKKDCFQKYEDEKFLKCYLYDKYKSQIFKKGGISYNETRMNKYMERKNKLDRFLLNFKSNGLSFMH